MDGFLAAVARHGIGIHFKDDVGDARLARRAGQMLAAHAEPYDDQMILEGFVLLGDGFLIDGHVHVAAHEGGDLGRDFHDRGGQHHGHDARREEHLVPVVVHEAAVHGGTGQHEGEFPDLREAHGGEDGDAQGVPHQQHGRQGQDGFQEDEQGREEEHLVQMVHEEAHVEQHTHGDEEQAGEDVLEGEDAFEDVEAVFRSGEQEPGEERAEGEGEAERGRAEGDGEAQAEHGHEHELLAPGTEHELHDAGDHMAGEDPASYEDHQRPPGGDEHPPEVRVPPPGEDRDGEHHGDDGDVLKDEHGKVEPALGGFGLRLLLEAAEHDGGGGQGGEEAVHHALLPRLAREHAEAHERADGQHHLRRAADEHGAFQPHEFFAGHFKADGEQQQDHADLRQQFDRVGVLDEPQGRGAAQDAGQQEPHDGRDFDLVADEQDADGKAENGDDVRKKRDVHSSGGSIKAERMNSTFF